MGIRIFPMGAQSGECISARAWGYAYFQWAHKNRGMPISLAMRVEHDEEVPRYEGGQVRPRETRVEAEAETACRAEARHLGALRQFMKPVKSNQVKSNESTEIMSIKPKHITACSLEPCDG